MPKVLVANRGESKSATVDDRQQSPFAFYVLQLNSDGTP